MSCTLTSAISGSPLSTYQKPVLRFGSAFTMNDHSSTSNEAFDAGLASPIAVEPDPGFADHLRGNISKDLTGDYGFVILSQEASTQLTVVCTDNLDSLILDGYQHLGVQKIPDTSIPEKMMTPNRFIQIVTGQLNQMKNTGEKAVLLLGTLEGGWKKFEEAIRGLAGTNNLPAENIDIRNIWHA